MIESKLWYFDTFILSHGNYSVFALASNSNYFNGYDYKYISIIGELVKEKDYTHQKQQPSKPRIVIED